MESSVRETMGQRIVMVAAVMMAMLLTLMLSVVRTSVTMRNVVESVGAGEPYNVAAKHIGSTDLSNLEELNRLKVGATRPGSPRSIEERLRDYEEEKAVMLSQVERDPARVLPDGGYFYVELDWIKEHIWEYYAKVEVEKLTLMVTNEDVGSKSDTVFAADVWSVLNRQGQEGFSGSDDILGILYSGEYDGVNSSKFKPDAHVREIVIDVLARKVMEDMGAPEALVGRVLPKEYCYFRNEDFADWRNHYYDDWQGGNEYDPFAAPYNPYST